jgi:soluble lytic murein transglycosylase-like protein
MDRQIFLMRSYLVAVALVALPTWAGESAVLSNGRRIHAERHEVDGSTVRLIVGGGEIDLPAGLVAGFEADEPAPKPEAPPVTQQSPPKAESPVTVPELLRGTAERYGLPPELIRSVARAESGYRPDAVSPKGAVGVMQLMPKTAAALSANPYDAAENIEAGTRLLCDLLQKYDGSTHRALAAYNAGPAAVDRYNGIPPYRETQLYVDRVVGDYLRQTARKSTSPRQSE